MLKENTFMIPHQWFARQGKFYAMTWKLHPVTAFKDFQGRQVCQDTELEFPTRQPFKNFSSFCDPHAQYSVPHPANILSESFLVHLSLSVFMINDEIDDCLRLVRLLRPTQTQWLAIYRKHVLALRTWLYCKDTSGNVPKRWNEHRSYLFMLAGLSREQLSKEYNVHFSVYPKRCVST